MSISSSALATLAFLTFLAISGCGQPEWKDAFLSQDEAARLLRQHRLASAVDLDQPPFLKAKVELVDFAISRQFVGGKTRDVQVYPPPGWSLGLLTLPEEVRSGYLAWADGMPVYHVSDTDTQRRVICLLHSQATSVAVWPIDWQEIHTLDAQQTTSRINRLLGLPLGEHGINLMLSLVQRATPPVDSALLDWLDLYRTKALPILCMGTEKIVDGDNVYQRYRLDDKRDPQSLQPYNAAHRILELSAHTRYQPLVDEYCKLYSTGDPVEIDPKQGLVGALNPIPPTTAAALAAVAPNITEALLSHERSLGHFMSRTYSTLRAGPAAETAKYIAWAVSHDNRAIRDTGIKLFLWTIKTPVSGTAVKTFSSDEVLAAYALVKPQRRLQLASEMQSFLVQAEHFGLIPMQRPLFRTMVDIDFPYWLTGQNHSDMPEPLRHAVFRIGDDAVIAQALAAGYTIPLGQQIIAECVDSGNDDLAERIIRMNSLQPLDWIERVFNEAAERGMIKTLVLLQSQYPNKLSLRNVTEQIGGSGRHKALKYILEKCVDVKQLQPGGRFFHEVCNFRADTSQSRSIFYDEPGWAEELVKNGLLINGKDAALLLDRIVPRYPNTARALIAAGMPNAHVARFLHPRYEGMDESLALQQVAFILDAGISPDVEERKDIRPPNAPEWAMSRTPLGSAIFFGFPRIALLLIQHGADPAKPACCEFDAGQAIEKTYHTQAIKQALREAVAPQKSR